MEAAASTPRSANSFCSWGLLYASCTAAAELDDDVRRRAGRGHERSPGSGVVIGDARFHHRRHVRNTLVARPAGDRERPRVPASICGNDVGTESIQHVDVSRHDVVQRGRRALVRNVAELDARAHLQQNANIWTEDPTPAEPYVSLSGFALA